MIYMTGTVHDLFKHADLTEERLRDFGLPRGDILGFSVDLRRRHELKTTTASCNARYDRPVKDVVG